MSSELEQFAQLIATQVGIQQDKNIREQGEQTLKNIRTQQPDNYILFLLKILQEHQDDQYRIFCASQIRKTLSIFSESSYVNLWEKLSAETKKTFQTQIFIILGSIQSSQVRKLICEAIGEIGASLQEEFEGNGDQKPHEWNDLVPTLWKMFSTDDALTLECAFLILNTLIGYTPQIFDKHKNDLYVLFQNGIGNQNLAIKSAAIQCLGSYVEVSDTKVLKQFDALTKDMLQGIAILLEKDIDQGELGLDVLERIADQEPKFFQKNFTILFEFVKALFNMADLDKPLKQQAVDIIMEVIGKVPKMIAGKDDIAQSLCDHIFLLMVENDIEITEEWKKPEEGFNDDHDDDEEDSTKFGVNCIDRFITSIGETKALGIIGTTVQQLLQPSKGWRYQYAAIMALSQVGEYVDDIEVIAPTINMIVQYFNHENCKIRYAVCHAIGQIADDMKPEFQQKYHKDILPKLVEVCDDPVPRVSSHSFAAITNFVESIKKELIKDSLDAILKKSFATLQNGISLSKENAVSAIAASAEGAKEYFLPYFNEAMPVLFQVYEQHSAKEYKQLRGQTIECITLIAHGVDKQVYLPHLEKIVNILITLQESQFEQSDPQKSYVLSGWQRLCLIYHDELVPYLDKIIPSLFKLVQTVFSSSENEDDENQANTFDKDETEIAIHMLAVFITQLKQKFANFIQPTIDIIVPLCNYSKSQNIRTSAAKCLSSLITCVKDQPQIPEKLCKYFLDALYKAMQEEYDTEVLCSQSMSIKECLDEIKNPCFTEEELQVFADNLFKMLFDSDNRKAANEQCKDDQELDEDEKEQLEEENQMEEDFHVAIAEVMGQLFRTHGKLCANISKIIYDKILPRVLDPQLTFRMHKFGIFLVCDMVEHLKYDLLSEIWGNLLEALLKYSQDSNLQVRQASIYGIGIYAQGTPAEVFKNQANQVQEALNQAMIKTKQNKEAYQQKYNNKCLDNIVSAKGKIIKMQNTNINLQECIQDWVSYLPLKYDRKEGLINHYLLCDIAIESPNMLFSSEDGIKKVLSIYTSIIDTRLQTSNLLLKIKESLMVLGKEDFVKNNWNNLINHLSDEQKEKLNTLLATN